MTTQTKPLPIRYATTAAIPVGYNFARAMPNTIVPQWFEAARTAKNATHRLYRSNSGAVMRTVYIA